MCHCARLASALLNLKARLEQIFRVWSNHHFELSRLDCKAHLAIPERELLRSEQKLHSLPLTRLECNPLKPLQFFYRPRHARHCIADVELDHLIAHSLTGVLDLHTDS